MDIWPCIKSDQTVTGICPVTDRAAAQSLLTAADRGCKHAAVQRLRSRCSSCCRKHHYPVRKLEQTGAQLQAVRPGAWRQATRRLPGPMLTGDSRGLTDG